MKRREQIIEEMDLERWRREPESAEDALGRLHEVMDMYEWGLIYNDARR